MLKTFINNSEQISFSVIELTIPNSNNESDVPVELSDVH